MSHALPALLLAVCCILGLVLVPLGLPGLWIMVAGIVGYGWLTAFRSVGVATIAIVVGLAFLGEVIEAWLGFRFARTFGGSRRSAWGALVGGIVGAVMGVPVPVVGSVIGAFVGSFAGAALFEYSLSRSRPARLTRRVTRIAGHISPAAPPLRGCPATAHRPHRVAKTRRLPVAAAPHIRLGRRRSAFCPAIP